MFNIYLIKVCGNITEEDSDEENEITIGIVSESYLHVYQKLVVCSDVIVEQLSREAIVTKRMKCKSK